MIGAGEGIRTLDVLLGKLSRDKLAIAYRTNRLPPFRIDYTGSVT